MEISWKWSSFCLCLLFFQLCNGYPIDRGDTLTDQQTKLLTGIVSLLLTICGLVFLAGCLCCQRRNAFKEFQNSPVIGTVLSELDHGHINPIANGEFTIFTPLSPPHFNNNIFLGSDQIIAQTFQNQELNDFHLKTWFNDSEKDFPRIKLKYIKELGRGWFGKVVEGAAQDIANKGPVWTPVIVRILDATSSQKEKIIFLQDASIYRCSSHENILSLVGRCLETVPFLLLQEFCSQGDLKAYLRSKKSHPEQILSTEYPLLWCCQLTSALKHLHDNNITHPDFAARNCQLTSTLTLKVGDYGLGVFRYPGDYYQGSAGVPVRWRAPESLTCTQTTIQPKGIDREGNVWALGVTMWEICECGEQPYAALTDDEVVSRVLGAPHVRLTRPSFSAIYTDYIYRLMQLCWTNAESRPTVSQIHLMLADLLQVHQNTASDPSHESFSLEDFDQRWASLKPNSLVKTDDIAVPFPGLRKTLSPSLNNLHGSLDNLLADHGLFIEDELRNGFSSANDDSLTSEMVCNSDCSEQRISVKKKSKTKSKPAAHGDDGLSHSKLFQRTSSGSETEDDNWRNKVERGAYTEKVRQKSKSVADLMVLTHVDYSESESETPLPSLDYKVNYKNVRLAPTNSLETASITFASEGNLLSIQDTFQEELKKLQEERRDSLLFVPDSISSVNVTNLMQELNSTVEIQPANQVFNVFNVSIDNYSPLHVSKLEKIININETDMDIDDYRADTSSNDSQSPGDLLENERNSCHDSCRTVLSIVQVANVGEANLNDSLENIVAECEKVCDDKIAGHEIYFENIVHDNINFVNTTANEEIKTDQETPGTATETDDTNTNLENVASKCEIIKLSDDSDIVEVCHEVSVPKEVQKIDDSEQSTSKKCDDAGADQKGVDFDLSSEQDGAMPNSLTHFSVFTSTPFKKKDLSLPVEDKYSSINLYGNPEDKNESQDSEDKDLTYSLETWDNFLGKTFDYQDIESDDLFESFSSEPKSLMFVDDEHVGSEEVCCPIALNQTVITNEVVEERREDSQTDAEKNAKFVLNKKTDETFVIEEKTAGIEDNETYIVDNANLQDLSPNDPNSGSWESGGGWFLHPQSNTDDLCGDIKMQPNTRSDSYVGFGIDDEIMSAIRNELISKLPHAQSAAVEKVKEDDDWDSCERSEIFLKYNVYNTPLSPIPEESYIEDNSGANSPRKYCDHEDSDWSEHGEVETLTREIPSHSPQTLESPMRGTLNMHTPSQDSCCSNDTLFNLEELNFNAAELEKEAELNSKIFNNFDETEIHNLLNIVDPVFNHNFDKSVVMEPSINETEIEIIINEFLLEERNHASEEVVSNEVTKPNTLEVDVAFSMTHPVPLPSPEENPWKQLPASLVSIDKVASMSSSFSLENGQENDENIDNDSGVGDVPECRQNFEHRIIEEKSQCLDLQITDLDEELHDELEEPHLQTSESIAMEENSIIKISPKKHYSEDENIENLGDRTLENNIFILGDSDKKDEAVDFYEDTKTERVCENLGEQPSKTEDSNKKIEEVPLHVNPMLEIVELRSECIDESLQFEINSSQHNSELFKEEKSNELIVDKSKNTLQEQFEEKHHSEIDESPKKYKKALDEKSDGVDRNEKLEGFVRDQTVSSIDAKMVKSSELDTHSVENEAFNVNHKFEIDQTLTDILKIRNNLPSQTEIDEKIEKCNESVDEPLNILKNTEKEEIIQCLLKNDEKQESLEENAVTQKYEGNPLDNSDEMRVGIKEPEYANSAIDNPLPIYENQSNKITRIDNIDRLYENLTDEAEMAEKENYYENSDIKNTGDVYENLNSEELYDDYVNIVNMENVKNSLEYENSEKDGEYLNIYGEDGELHSEDENIFGVLTDIRFSGPSDSQLMSTSFSENNDDHDWDSGSDSRSSSSGEFIWKEGEHEESLKALRAAPQDLVENVKPMEGIAEGDYEGSDISSSFSDDEGETPEFVPSAWDKFAIPSKSALRSPEKTLKKTDEKPKGVWFKKQKYHCIYEYPKEPDSPELQSQDLWKPQPDFKSFADWEFDGEPYIPIAGDEQDILGNMGSTVSPLTSVPNNRSLYQLTSISDFMNGESDNQAYSDEFFISGSNQPFHSHSLSSQFFPGSTMWAVENATPDSGVEDITPGSLSDAADYPKLNITLPTLQQLASEAVNKKKLALAKRKEVLGGLRHTRDRLKLDLPPSPSAFTSEKLFAVEPFVEPFVREKPTFSTFGKSRFQVQHVDTPVDELDAKNVSFEALPYKASSQIVQKEGSHDLERNIVGVDSAKTNIELVRGEASVLDSGDEDSGIESSTLERRTKNIQI